MKKNYVSKNRINEKQKERAAVSPSPFVPKLKEAASMQTIQIIAVTAILLCVAPLLFMVCFNFVVPLFWAAAPSLTFLHSIALVVAVRILIGQNPLGAGVEKE